MFCRPLKQVLVISLVLLAVVLGRSQEAGDGAQESGVRGQGPGRGKRSSEQRYHVSRWTAEDGLPQNRVGALAQTPDGYLWVGTWSGLARFDGARFTLFNEVNTPAMKSQSINALAVDDEGNLWIGTSEGLLLYRNRQFTRFTKAEGLANEKVWRLVRSRNGGVWMQCGSHIVQWRNGRRSIKVSVQMLPTEEVRSLKEQDDGSVTVVTTHAMRRITSGGELETVAVPALAGAPIVAWDGMWQQRDRLWMNLWEGLWLFKEGSWKQIVREPSRGEAAHFMYEDRMARVWINRGEAGFWRCAGEAAEPFKLGERGAEKSVDCMLEDAEGHLWFGTAHGLFRLRPTLIRAVTAENGLPSDQCWSVCEGSDGAIWVETKAGVARIENEQVQTFQAEPRSDRGRCILADGQGSLWLGNRHDGLISWRPGAQTNWFWDRGEAVTVEALYSDRHGRVWVGTDRGVTWFEEDKPAATWGQFDLPTSSVRSIYQTRDGAMWFGTWKGGAVRWNGLALKRQSMMESAPRTEAPVRVNRPLNPALSPSGGEGEKPTAFRWPETISADAAIRTTRFTTADGLADDRVFVFHEDVEGVLWVGTHNGLSRFKEGRFFTFRTEHGLLDNLINWLEEDEFGRFWVSCNRGIFRMDRRELNAVADGQKPRANMAVYGTADGMPIAETNGEHQPAGCKARDGRLWFPTPQGVVVIDPRAVKQNEAHELPPPVVIEQVLADGELIYGDGLKLGAKSPGQSSKLVLPPGRAKVLEIRYTATSFGDPRRVKFQYRLSNRDDSWREVSDERVAYYTDLRPGDFRFELKAASPHGIWNETPAVFEFSLTPYFYQTWPFYFTCAAALSLAGLGIHHRRVLVLRRLQRLEQQRALQEERARIARDLHDDLGANLTGIALKADLAQRQLQTAAGPAGQFGEIASSTRGLVDQMRETVWALNPKHDTLESLARFLAQYVQDFVTDAGLRCRLELPDQFPALTVPSPTRYNTYMVVKEAVHNAVKHANAREVRFKVQIEAQNLCLGIADDGDGFGDAPSQGAKVEGRHSGNGLPNMLERVKRFGGDLEIKTGDDKGTEITVRIPMKFSVSPIP
jgi:signal transduction histidine kinase/ligand-binding sensor domain-containing protein